MVFPFEHVFECVYEKMYICESESMCVYVIECVYVNVNLYKVCLCVCMCVCVCVCVCVHEFFMRNESNVSVVGGCDRVSVIFQSKFRFQVFL